MAYVKKSESVFVQLKGRIKSMFSSQHQHAERWDNYGLSLDEINQKIWDSIMPTDVWIKVNDLQQSLPGSFPMTNKVFVKISPDPKANWSNYVLYPLVFAQDRPVPSKWSSSYTHDNAPTCSDPDIVRISLERKAKVLRVEEATNAFLKEVEQAWESVASVNAFVKVWPAGRDLLPPEVISKLNEKVERTKTSSLNIDTAKLNTELLKAKIVA